MTTTNNDKPAPLDIAELRRLHEAAKEPLDWEGGDAGMSRRERVRDAIYELGVSMIDALPALLAAAEERDELPNDPDRDARIREAIAEHGMAATDAFLSTGRTTPEKERQAWQRLDEARAALLALMRPAPPAVDPEREKRIEKWQRCSKTAPIDEPGGRPYAREEWCVGTPDSRYVLFASEIDEALALMRSAPPPAVDPEREAKIEAWRAETAEMLLGPLGYDTPGEDRRLPEWAYAILGRAVSLMRSAPPPSKIKEILERQVEALEVILERIAEETTKAGRPDGHDIVGWIRSLLLAGAGGGEESSRRHRGDDPRGSLASHPSAQTDGDTVAARTAPRRPRRRAGDIRAVRRDRRRRAR